MAKRRKMTSRFVDPMTGRTIGPTREWWPFSPTPGASVTEALEASAADDDPYPIEGNVPEVIGWVDRAPTEELRSERAKAATAAEAGRDHPRTTLQTQLAERTG